MGVLQRQLEASGINLTFAVFCFWFFGFFWSILSARCMQSFVLGRTQMGMTSEDSVPKDVQGLVGGDRRRNLKAPWWGGVSL